MKRDDPGVQKNVLEYLNMMGEIATDGSGAEMGSPCQSSSTILERESVKMCRV